VEAVVVFAPIAGPSGLGSGGWSASVSGYKFGMGGSYEIAKLNMASVTASNYITNHVHIAADLTNPGEKDAAEKIISALYNTVFNAQLNGTGTFQDPLGNTYRGTELVTLMQKMDFNLADTSLTANGAETTYSSPDLGARATIAMGLAKLAGYDANQIGYVVDHELGHALPSGHQVGEVSNQAFFNREGYLYTDPADYQAHWSTSPEHTQSEKYANSLGLDIANFTYGHWLVGVLPSEGYYGQP
jgi:hypothetical protein